MAKTGIAKRREFWNGTTSLADTQPVHGGATIKDATFVDGDLVATVPNAASLRYAVAMPPMSDGEAAVTFTSSVAGLSMWVGLAISASVEPNEVPSDGYTIRSAWVTNGYVRVDRTQANSATTLQITSGVNFLANTRYRYKIKKEGTTIRRKVWAVDNEAEPAWTTMTDNNPTPPPAGIVRFYASNGTGGPVDMKFEDIVVTPAAPVPYWKRTSVPRQAVTFNYDDDFSTDRKAWGMVRGTGTLNAPVSALSVVDGTLRSSVAYSSQRVRAILEDMPVSGDTEMFATFRLDTSTAGQYIHFGICASDESPDPNNGYMMYLSYSNDGALFGWVVQRRKNGVGTNTLLNVQNTTANVGERVSIRFRRIGNQISAKFWKPDSQSEPVWLTATDNDSPLPAGRVRFGYLSLDNSKVTADMSLEHVTVTSPDAHWSYVSPTLELNPAPEVVSVATGTSTAATDVEVPKPAGTSEGDLLVAVVPYRSGGAVMTAPEGWTELHRNTATVTTLTTFWKVASSTEPDSYTFTVSISGRQAAGIARITGAPTNPTLAVVPSTSLAVLTTNLETASFTAPSGQNYLLLEAFASSDGTATITEPAGTTKHWSFSNLVIAAAVVNTLASERIGPGQVASRVATSTNDGYFASQIIMVGG